MPAPLLQGTRLSFTISPINDGTLLAVAVGELVIINVRWYSTGTINVLTVDGQAATLLGTPQIGGPDNARSQWALWWNAGASGNKVVAAGITTGSGAVEAWRVSGADTTTPVVVRNGASGNNTTPSVTLAGCPAECLGLAIGSSQGGDWASPTAPWTLITVTDAVWFDSGAQAADLGAAGNKTLSATIPSSSWGINAIAIQQPVATGGALSGDATLPGPSAAGGLAGTGSEITGDAVMPGPSAAGGLEGGTSSAMSGDATLPGPSAAGGLASGSGTFTSEVLERNNGAAVGVVSLDFVSFHNPDTGALVVLRAGVSTNAGGVFTVSDPLLVPGTSYLAVWRESTGQRGWGVATAT